MSPFCLPRSAHAFETGHAREVREPVDESHASRRDLSSGGGGGRERVVGRAVLGIDPIVFGRAGVYPGGTHGQAGRGSVRMGSDRIRSDRIKATSLEGVGIACDDGWSWRGP
jgi:hypothetical protein